MPDPRIIPLTLVQANAASAMIQNGIDAGAVDPLQGAIMLSTLDPGNSQTHRTVIQIEPLYIASVMDLLQLCDDGTIWHYFDDGAGVIQTQLDDVTQGFTRPALELLTITLGITASAVVEPRDFACTVAMHASLTGDAQVISSISRITTIGVALSYSSSLITAFRRMTTSGTSTTSSTSNVTPI
jgi:hypothetical protein